MIERSNDVENEITFTDFYASLFIVCTIKTWVTVSSSLTHPHEIQEIGPLS